MKTRFLTLLSLTLLLIACRTTPSTETPLAITLTSGAAPISGTSTSRPNAAEITPQSPDDLATQRADTVATLHAAATQTALIPTSTPTITPIPRPTNTPAPTPTNDPNAGLGGGPGGGGAGGGCSGGCGGGGGGGGGGFEQGPYDELGAPAGDEADAEPTPDMMFFEDYGTNPFVGTGSDGLSTFAVDVDTGSYTLTRRYLNDGMLPPPEAVRLEEFVNYFPQDYPIPTQEETFSITTEAAPTIFNAADSYVLRVGVQGYELDPALRPDADLVFVVDVSGSMEMENRLEAVKLALIDLVDQLRPTDTIGIVAYTDDAFIVLNPTPVSEGDRIKTAIRGLYTMGSTNVQAGLLLGYQIAYETADPKRLNRIILCSDGVANTGDVTPEDILATVDQYARDDIMLTTVGFGMGNYNDVLMEQIADNGGGQYYYVDSYPEARRLFVDELTTTLVTIARDAKIQVQFNPATVAYYRLMGYENRDIADVDFRDDSVDGGEINAGHSITALYEIIPTDYNQQGPIALVTLRWIDPATGQAREMSRSVEVWERRQGLDDTSASFQLDIAAAAFADKLSNGAWAQNITWEDLTGLMAWLSGGFPGDPDVPEFDALVRRAAQLDRH